MHARTRLLAILLAAMSSILIAQTQVAQAQADQLQFEQSPHAEQQDEQGPFILDTTAPLVALDGPPSSSEQVDTPINELVRQRFPDGTVQLERWIVETEAGDFVNHGAYTEYNVQGDVMRSGEYRHGLRHGEWSQIISAEKCRQLVGPITTSFRPPFHSKAQFDEGQLSGDWTCTDSAGNIVFVWSFRGGAREGLSSWFDGSGQVVRAITYRENSAHGPAKVIVKGGGNPQDVKFEKGRMRHHVEQWYPVAKGAKQVMRSQDWYLVPTPLNLASHDWENCRVEYQSVDENDKIRHGLSVSYYRNGIREAQGQYDYGQRIGTFSWWYPNGQERTMGAFENDLEQGEWTWWHENGMKQARGSFKVGEKISTWSVWDSSGKLVQRVQTDHQQVAERETQTERH